MRKRLLALAMSALLVIPSAGIGASAEEYTGVNELTEISAYDEFVATENDAEEIIDESVEAPYATAVCETYSGRNIDYNNYSRKKAVVTSYLAKTGTNEWMRVQSNAVSNGYLVQYFDGEFNHKKSVIVPKQLSLFGGVYVGSTYNFIVTGQTNYDEDNSVEVLRVSKYDKNWNYISKASLYGSDIVAPFSTGIDCTEYNGNLIVRTSRTKYKSDDGFNHQTNLTMVIKQSTMAILGESTANYGRPYGYSSHSFAQYVRVDASGNFAAIDHGDAYPRAVQLSTSSTVFNTTPGSASSTDIYKIAGATGNNDTGVSVGGFEIGSTNYVTACNSTIQDANSLNYKTRNILVLITNKSTKATTEKWITNITEGTGTATTPFLVKLSNTNFLLMWSVGSKVYYTKMTESGSVGTIYNFEGSLSDCQPVLDNGIVTWYTWNNDELKFYQIDTANISKQTITEIVNGHVFENKGVVDGYAQLECTRCGEEQKILVPTSLTVYWRTDQTQNSYSSAISTKQNVGIIADYWIISLSPSGADKNIIVESSDESVIKVDKNNSRLLMLADGTATITMRSKYDSKILLQRTFTVGNAQEVAVTSIKVTADKTTIVAGEKAQFTATIYPSNATDKSIIWQSNDTSVATVDQSGVVTGVAEGRTAIFAVHDYTKQIWGYTYITVEAAPEYKAELVGSQIKLKDTIDMDFYMELEGTALDKGAYLSVSIPNGIEQKIDISEAKTTVMSGKTYYVFTGTFAAKEMATKLSIKYVMPNGEETKEKNYSIRENAKYILDNSVSTSKAIPFVKSMLNYGAASQIYLDYNTSDLANNILSETDKAVAECPSLSAYTFTKPNNTANVSYVGTSLLLKSEIRLRVYFTSNYSLSVSDYTVTIGGTKCDSSRLVVGSDDKGRQYLEIAGMTPVNYGKSVVIKVKDMTVSGLSVYGYIDSANTSTSTKQNLKDVLAALYYYGENAKIYVNGN